MIINHDEKHPFPGARTLIEPPIDSNAFRPKAWDINGSSDMGSGTLQSAGHDFQAEGILIGDPLFLCAGTPNLAVATTVAGFLGPTVLQINWMADKNYTDILFKVGEAALHTFNTLINIVVDRGIAAYTIHFASFWVDARFRDFNRDETGDIYTIDPEEEKKLNGMNRVNGTLVPRPVQP